MSIHINDQLNNLNKSSTIVIPTIFNTFTLSSIDIQTNVGTNDVLESIDQPVVLSSDDVNNNIVSDSTTTSLKALTIEGSDVGNPALVDLIDTQLIVAEPILGGNPNTFVKYDDDGSIFTNELFIGNSLGSDTLTKEKVTLLTNTLNGSFHQLDKYVS